MAIPTDSGVINEKIANGDVKVKKRSKKKEVPHADVPKAVEKTKKAKKQEEGKKAPEPKELNFPVNGFINKYHFMRVSGAILEKLGWPIDKQVNVTLDVQDGALVVRKR
jgi:hypothetical protein